MKSWKVGGATLIVVGLAALTFRFGCDVDLEVTIKDDVTPIEHRFGWDPELAQSDAAKKLVASMPKFAITGVKRDNRRANIRLWDCAEQIGVEVPDYPQAIGDCVSFGFSSGVDFLQCVQISLGQRSEFQSCYEPFVYGISRVQVGGGRLGNGDGSIGAWAAKALMDYGALSSDADGVPKYSGKIAKHWGYHGPPEEFLRIAKETVVRTAAPVRSADEVREAICNGYPCPVCSSAGFSISKRHDRLVGRRTKVWHHCMLLLGYDGSEDALKAGDGEPLYYCLNSWGPNWQSSLQGEPHGGFWMRESDVERIVDENDSYALSGFTGFPAQDPLDFDVIKAKRKAKQPKHKERRHAKSFAQAL